MYICIQWNKIEKKKKNYIVLFQFQRLLDFFHISWSLVHSIAFIEARIREIHFNKNKLKINETNKYIHWILKWIFHFFSRQNTFWSCCWIEFESIYHITLSFKLKELHFFAYKQLSSKNVYSIDVFVNWIFEAENFLWFLIKKIINCTCIKGLLPFHSFYFINFFFWIFIFFLQLHKVGLAVYFSIHSNLRISIEK